MNPEEELIFRQSAKDQTDFRTHVIDERGIADDVTAENPAVTPRVSRVGPI